MAKGNKRKFGNFRYPIARLENDSDYLEIKVVEYQAPGFETSGTGQALRLQTSSESLKKNKENILGTIFLPVPEAVTDSNGVSWGENTLNGLEAAGHVKIMGAIYDEEDGSWDNWDETGEFTGNKAFLNPDG